MTATRRRHSSGPRRTRGRTPTLPFSASHTYGDNGTFTVQVCAADDDTTPCTTFPLQIDNTKPTAVIDLSGAVTVNGTATIIAHAGQAVAFTGRSTDPGSDDLTLAWDMGRWHARRRPDLARQPAEPRSRLRARASSHATSRSRSHTRSRGVRVRDELQRRPTTTGVQPPATPT